MTAQIVQFRDYQSKAAIERAHKALEDHLNREAIQIANECFPSVLGFPAPQTDYSPNRHWPSMYRSPEKDPA